MSGSNPLRQPKDAEAIRKSLTVILENLDTETFVAIAMYALNNSEEADKKLAEWVKMNPINFDTKRSSKKNTGNVLQEKNSNS